MTLTKEDFAVEMGKLFSAQGREVRHETLDVYWNSLHKMTLEQFRHAIGRSIENDELFPKIPKLWAYAREMKISHADVTHFTFLHKECDLPFSCYVDELVNGKWFICDACKFYSEKFVRWSGEFLRKKMVEAVEKGESIVIL